MIDVNFKKLNPEAKMPYHGSASAAGYDLYSIGDWTIPVGETIKIPTGIAIELPEGTFGAIFPRSGLATKRGLRLANCVAVIDSDYRGEWLIPLYNDSEEPQTIESGERIAQTVIIPYLPVNFIEVEDINTTERGAGGFGHSGIK